MPFYIFGLKHPITFASVLREKDALKHNSKPNMKQERVACGLLSLAYDKTLFSLGQNNVIEIEVQSLVIDLVY